MYIKNIDAYYVRFNLKEIRSDINFNAKKGIHDKII